MPSTGPTRSPWAVVGKSNGAPIPLSDSEARTLDVVVVLYLGHHDRHLDVLAEPVVCEHNPQPADLAHGQRVQLEALHCRQLRCRCGREGGAFDIFALGG